MKKKTEFFYVIDFSSEMTEHSIAKKQLNKEEY